MRGALFMAVSMAGFTINDGLSKLLMESMNMGQVMLVRGIFATALIGTLAGVQGVLSGFRQLAHPMVALRSACELVATVLFLVALMHMPLANVSAVLQALPLAVTMGAALFLGEKVGWRRWLAICIGFSGVLIIVRPGFEGFNAFSLLALSCVMFAAARDVATRLIPQEIPSVLVSTATAAMVTGAGAILIMPLGGWTPMTAGQTGILATSAVLLLFGYQFIIMAMRIGDISFVAPFRYTALLWAIVLGVLLFSHMPDAPMLVGASIVIGSGLYALYREQIVGRHKPAAESTGPGMGTDGL